MEKPENVSEILKRIEVNMQNMEKKITDKIAKSNAELQKTIKCLDESMSVMSENITQQGKRIDEVEKQSASHKLLTEQLQSRIEDMQRNLQARNADIRGIPVIHGEKIKEYMMKIAETVDHNLKDSDIIKAYRSAPSMNKTERYIVVIFNNDQTKNELMKAIKTFNMNITETEDRLSTNHLGLAEKKPIYMLDQLSPLSKKILGVARKLLKERKVKYVWTTGGKVYIKVEEGGAAIAIRTLDQMNKYSKEDRNAQDGESNEPSVEKKARSNRRQASKK